MTRLRQGIPRLLKNHRSPEGVALGGYLRAQIARCQLDPRDPAPKPTLRELGLTELDLRRVRAELEQARTKPNRKKRVRVLERDTRKLRVTLISLEKHLERYASPWRRRQLERDSARALRIAASERATGEQR